MPHPDDTPFSALRKRLGRSLKAGFSLIEVNMAIFVLAGGALALIALFPMGLRESLASRNEMRVAAFAERLLGAAQIAACDPEVTTADDLADALASAPFNFEIDEDAGDYDTASSAHEDPTSGVYYRAWLLKDDAYQGANYGDKEVAQIGVQVTAENAKQNRRALRSAPVYVLRVVVDKKNKP